MSYIIIGFALLAAVGIWFFAANRDQTAASTKLRKAQAEKRKVFNAQAAVAAGLAPSGGQKRKRGFGLRG